ncbi:hypothetical protein [Stenomitos frigidus]
MAQRKFQGLCLSSRSLRLLYEPVNSRHPYGDKDGVTFADLDGYRVVL